MEVKIETYQTKSVPVCTLQDWELAILIENCCELYGSHLNDRSLPAYKILLTNKFRMITDTQIFNACLENSSNPAYAGQRMSPQFLASIIVTKKRDELPTYNYGPEPSAYEKQQIKDRWLSDLYQDFADYCNGKKTSRIFVWRYLADKLMEAGLIEQRQMATANKNANRRSDSVYSISEFESSHRPICEGVFKALALQGKQISDYIK